MAGLIPNITPGAIFIAVLMSLFIRVFGPVIILIWLYFKFIKKKYNSKTLLTIITILLVIMTPTAIYIAWEIQDSSWKNVTSHSGGLIGSPRLRQSHELAKN